MVEMADRRKHRSRNRSKLRVSSLHEGGRSRDVQYLININTIKTKSKHASIIKKMSAGHNLGIKTFTCSSLKRETAAVGGMQGKCGANRLRKLQLGLTISTSRY